MKSQKSQKGQKALKLNKAMKYAPAAGLSYTGACVRSEGIKKAPDHTGRAFYPFHTIRGFCFLQYSIMSGVSVSYIGTCRNNVTDGGGSDTTKDKFFLLSRRELFMGDEVSSVKEGEPYPYYSNYSDYTSPNTGADSNRVKYKNGSPQWQWERTPSAGNSYNVRPVSYAGNLYNYGAYNSNGVAPACNVI